MSLCGTSLLEEAAPMIHQDLVKLGSSQKKRRLRHEKKVEDAPVTTARVRIGPAGSLGRRASLQGALMVNLHSGEARHIRWGPPNSAISCS
jgi:hypothetical protein